MRNIFLGCALLMVGCVAPDQVTEDTSISEPAVTSCRGVRNGTACDDGNACTTGDTCQNGRCRGGNPVVCAAPPACHTAGVCDPTTGQCTNSNAPNGTACAPGSVCQGGVCQQSGGGCTCPQQCAPGTALCGAECVPTRGVPSITPCNGACPSGYAMCTGPGIVPFCGRTRWDFEEGPPVDDLTFEWASGDGSAIHAVMSPRVHSGSWSSEIQSDPVNWNTQPNEFMCGATSGATMDLRSKTFNMSMFLDGPPLSGAFCNFGVFSNQGDELLPLQPFAIQFGTWFQFSKFLGNNVGQAGDLVFTCNFGAWPGNLFIDDISVN